MFARAIILALFSAAILASEIALTRIFSVIFWYHFGFLILSTSLLGFAVGGLAIRMARKRLEGRDPDRLLIVLIAASGVTLAAGLHFITTHHFSPLFVEVSHFELVKLVMASVVLVAPFSLMGAAIIYVLQCWPKKAGLLYGANLAGSGAGCLLALYLMDGFGGLTAFLILAASMPFVAAIYAWPRWRRAAIWSLFGAAVVLASIGVQERIFPLSSPARKYAAWVPPSSAVFSDWTSLSKVDIYKEEQAHSLGFGLWGLSPLNQAPLPERLGVIIDYWAYTTIVKHKQSPGYYDFYESLPMYMAYRLLDDPSALVIGSGGGLDIRGALLAGASSVDAVEINPAIYRAVNGELADYSGGVYSLPGVTGHLAEGRRFVESSSKRFDVIQLSGVDTYSATQAGAFALSENFLYTIEAMEAYYNHLAEGGILTLTRWYGPGKQGLPRFSIRLFTLAVDSLEARGIGEVGRHIMLIRSGAFTVILIKLTPFDEDEIRTVDNELTRRGYEWLHHPGKDVPDADVFRAYLNSKDRANWLDDYPFNVAAPTDDSPFFFEHRKLGNITSPESFAVGFKNGMDGQTILAILLLEMLAVSILLLVFAFRLEGSRRNPAGWLLFAALGFGFMFVEVALSQRLVLILGHPARALSVVMFSVLLFSGLGSWLSGRVQGRKAGALLVAAVAVFWLLMASVSTPLLQAMVNWPFSLRILGSILLIALPALPMGMALPFALRRLSAANENQLGLYWAFNGVASVTASVLCVIVAMGSGFSAVFLLAGICYAIAALLLSRLPQ